MPALLELQRTLREQLFGLATDGEATDSYATGSHAAGVATLLAGDDGALRLAIYRNTGFATLVNALRLSFPAVQRLVGADFFEEAAREFIRVQPPCSAYLNDYGADFPGFLAGYPPAAAVVYLGDVAQLEWAVSQALHASDAPRLDLSRLAGLDQSVLSRLSFTPHPALSLVRLEFPADAIWRAVLEQNDAAMAAIDLASGPVHLLIERDTAGVQVRALSAAAWDFTARLGAGRPLYAVLADGSEGDVDAWLAEHLALGRFIDFSYDTVAAVTVAAGETR